jgi:hypothetical protein
MQELQGRGKVMVVPTHQKLASRLRLDGVFVADTRGVAGATLASGRRKEWAVARGVRHVIVIVDVGEGVNV